MTGESAGSASDADAFWEAAEPLIADGTLEEGTIMGGACVRTAAGEREPLLRESVAFVG